MIQMANKRVLTSMANLVIVSLLLASCNVTGVPSVTTPTPVAVNSTPTTAMSTSQTAVTPTRPADDVQHIIQHLQANLATANIQSYVVTETTSARQVVQAHMGMSVAPIVTGEQQLHTTTTIWYQKPNRWRIETSKTSYVDQNEAGTWPPVQVSDGTNLWSYDPQNKIANTHPLTAPGFNEIGFSDIITRSYTQLRGLNSSCYNPPILQANDTVLGRVAYTIDSGGMHCPAPILPEFMGKRTLWFDQQTGLLLKDILYYSRDNLSLNRLNDNQPLDTWQVTGLQLNVAIEPSIFSFTPPPGTNVLDVYAFHQPYATPVGGRYSPNSLTSVDQARQELNFPIFIPTYLPAGLAAEPPTLNTEGPGIESLQIFYHDHKGQIRLEVMNSTPDKLGNLAAQADETVTLANGITAYYRYDDTLYWEQEGTYVAIGEGPYRSAIDSGCPSLLGKQQLIKIANSMSKTANLNNVQAQPTMPPTVLDQLRQQVCYPVFVPTYVPAVVAAEPPEFGSSLAEVWGVRINYHTSDGATAFSIISSSPPAPNIRNPFAMNVEQVRLPNGITASFFVRPVECGDGQTSLSWAQDDTFILIEGSPPDGKAGHFQLTKDELIKIAASVSSTAELGNIENPHWPPPTALPQPEGTASTCPPEP
jgi:outer membrane lipoprotein-sorting protein